VKPYPIFLIGLENRHCIVIGGTHEGEKKVEGLLECRAVVTVIAPELTPRLQTLADVAEFTWLKRLYSPGDLHGAYLVIAERADPDTNALIWREAEREGALVNVMDDVANCSFVAGSVVRQGALTLSISTSGAAPALSVRLRQRLEAEFGTEYAIFLHWMKHLRVPMAQTYPAFGERKRRWYALVDSDVLTMLHEDRLDEAQRLVTQIVGFDLPSFDLKPLEETTSFL
jgi:precorrin-2 dehydrogenase / sirohydrochlorin ferrochelatase